MIRPTRSCHEGESAERALELMAQLGVDLLPVVNDNDRVTGVIVGDELRQLLGRQGASALRMRDVMRRFGFLVCHLSDGLEQIRALASEAMADCAVLLDSAGRCVGVVDRRGARHISSGPAPLELSPAPA